MPSSRFTFYVLILVVAIAGMSQGLTLPLLSILLEKQGISSVANGFNAAALYIGILFVSPWLELVLRRFGYRTTIIAGMVLVTVTTLLFPVFQNYLVWFWLRFLLGIGDSALHYASQMWVTAISPPERRGRDISLYGFAYGAGFSVGPLGMLLLPLGAWAPFLAVSLFYAVSFYLLGRLQNTYPQVHEKSANTANRYSTVLRWGWLALLPPFLYGYMEATLNVNFPVYALRNGISTEWVSLILPAFVIGSLALQLPLGRWSDRIGRQKLMMGTAAVGAVMFFLFPLAGTDVWWMMLFSAIVGAAVGSFYSLGLALAADILPGSMVPTAGIMAGMNFSIASIMAPNFNGWLIDRFWQGSMFWVMSILLALFTVSGFFFRRSGINRPIEAEAVSD
jgi:MFS family permease